MSFRRYDDTTELVSFHPHLEDLLAGYLDAAVAGLRLLLGQFLAEDLELLDKVPLVLGHREALGLLRELSRGHQSLLGLILQLVLTTGEVERPKRAAWEKGERGEEKRGRKGPRERDRGTRLRTKNRKERSANRSSVAFDSSCTLEVMNRVIEATWHILQVQKFVSIDGERE